MMNIWKSWTKIFGLNEYSLLFLFSSCILHCCWCFFSLFLMCFYMFMCVNWLRIACKDFWCQFLIVSIPYICIIIMIGIFSGSYFYYYYYFYISVLCFVLFCVFYFSFFYSIRRTSTENRIYSVDLYCFVFVESLRFNLFPLCDDRIIWKCFKPYLSHFKTKIKNIIICLCYTTSDRMMKTKNLQMQKRQRKRWLNLLANVHTTQENKFFSWFEH